MAEDSSEAYNSLSSGSSFAKINWKTSGPAIDKGGGAMFFVFRSARIRVTRIESHSLILSYPHIPASSGASDIFTAFEGHGCQAYTFHTSQHSCKFCKFWNKS